MSYKKKGAILCSIILIVSIILGLGGGLESYAAGKITTIPSNVQSLALSAMSSGKGMLRVGRSTLSSYRWLSGGAGGTMKSYAGTDYFCLPLPSNQTKTYNNVLELNFKNVGKFGDRYINCKVTVTKVISYPVTISGWGSAYDGQIINMWSNGLGISDNLNINGQYHCRGGNKETWCNVQFTYADTGAIVQQPFYQTQSDMDVANYEWVEFQSGYTGEMICFPQKTMAITFNGNSAKCVSKGPLQDGTACYTQGSVTAPTVNGNFSFRVNACDCGCGINFFSSFVSMKNPTKSVLTSGKYYNGDTVKYSIKQNLLTFYSDQFTVLSSMQFKDVLPEELDYVSCKLLHNGVDKTSAYGSAAYNSSTRTLTYTLNSATLNNKNFYNGKVLDLQITCKKARNGERGIIPNAGSVLVDSMNYVTNTVNIQPKFKVSTSYEGQGSISEDVSDIDYGGQTTCSYTPEEDWYLYSITIDKGLPLKGKDLSKYLEEYPFKDIKANHTIHVVFKEIPFLTIEKQLIGSEREDFGSSIFLFKVTGEDTLGNQHTWFKSINGNGSERFRVPAGVYTVEELENDRFSQESITGVLNATEKGICTTVEGDAHVLFSNQLTDYTQWGHNWEELNELK